MNLKEILQTFTSGDAVLIAFLFLTLVQITPIKINPWSFVAKHVGRAINGEVMRKQEEQQKSINEIKDELCAMQRCTGRKRADDARNRILRFDDELRRQMKHSKEFFEQIIDDCDFYDQYGKDHPKYPNGKAKSAIKHIRTVYDEVKETNDFI